MSSLKLKFIENGETMSRETRHVFEKMIIQGVCNETDKEVIKKLLNGQYDQITQQTVFDFDVLIGRYTDFIVKNFSRREKLMFFSQTIGLKCGFDSAQFGINLIRGSPRFRWMDVDGNKLFVDVVYETPLDGEVDYSQFSLVSDCLVKYMEV